MDVDQTNGGKFGVIPPEGQWTLTPRTSGGGAALAYFCDNETVDGVEFPAFPKNLEGDDAPLVCADMSSNFISRKVDVCKYDKYSDIYRVVPDKTVRSRMNICFRVHGGDADKEKAFLAGAEKQGLLGLKGHRSVGGIRASNFPRASTGTCVCFVCMWTGRSRFQIMCVDLKIVRDDLSCHASMIFAKPNKAEN
ncbi:hypothetical protein P171DRAFT_486382 [Karstenula rhodostoma CBS 690.94]|uniref:Uncharacterized protein n=1 Tax=Karstenula rhodostoma CBS 690.94 TaxID=1392251 RepID=A0A9P4UAW6_9PLEO|nr:hypothetical protein P171DRAFT_486382 [Karstenula rhodostoma CBS 690.94]